VISTRLASRGLRSPYFATVFFCRPAGSTHAVVSPQGALILAFFIKPNRFFD
jgi:hypothetical protein